MSPRLYDETQGVPPHQAQLFLSALEKSGNRLTFKRPRLSGEEWFLVSIKWWKGFESQLPAFPKDTPPLLDNSSLLDNQSGKLREGLIQGLHFEAIPGDIYRQLKSWFPLQLSGVEIPRRTCSDGTIEVYRFPIRVILGEQEWETEFSKDSLLGEIADCICDHFGVASLASLKLFKYADYVPLDLAKSSGHCLQRLVSGATHIKLLVGVEASSSVVKSPPVVSSSTLFSLTPKPSPEVETVGLLGLANIGNSCYLNAVLQCLSNTSPFRAKLLILSNVRSRMNSYNALGQRGESLMALHTMFVHLWAKRGTLQTPSEFKRALDKWTPLFRGSSQHDAHEALQYLLDVVHEDSAFAGKESICEEVFGGVLDRTLTCPVCEHHVKATPEPFHIVSLPLEHPAEVVFVPLSSRPKFVSISSSFVREVREEIGRRVVLVLVVDGRATVLDDSVRFNKEQLVVAFEVEEGEARRVVCGVHVHEEQRVPFVLSLGQGEDVKDALYARFGSGFTLVTNCDDALVVEWEDEVPRNAVLPSPRKHRTFSLPNILAKFCAEETMEGDNLWFCPKCDTNRASVLTRYTFAKLPQVLILHLKRFSNEAEKVGHAVRYPMELRVGAETYELYALLRHHGSNVNSGHYDAQVKNAVNGRWYTFNDSRVTNLEVTFRGMAFPTKPKVADPSAYIFFYRRL